MEQPTRFVGMAVHEDTIVVAVTATGEVEGRAAWHIPQHRRGAGETG
jgi:hypothetical protein